MIDANSIKFHEVVWHGQDYTHPQLGKPCERDFFDRILETQGSAKVLRDPSGKRAVAIIGERRSGKTSMLKMLANLLSSDPRYISIQISYLSVYSSNDLIQDILHNLYFELDTNIPEENNFFERIKKVSAVNEFLQILKELTAFTLGKTIIICVDELDSIICQTPSLEEKEKVLAIVAELIDMGSLSLKLLFSACSLHELEVIPGLISTEMIEPFHLKPFGPDDLNEMIRTLLHNEILLSQVDLERIYALSGGWPYFAKLILLYLLPLRPAKGWVDSALANALTDHCLEQAVTHIYDNHFEPFERIAVFLLAQFEDGVISKRFLQTLNSPLEQAVLRLVERDYFVAAPNGDVSFRVGLLQPWFLNCKFKDACNKDVTEALKSIGCLDNYLTASKNEVLHARASLQKGPPD